MNKIFLIATGLLLGACCKEDFITPGESYDFKDGAIDVTTLLNENECSFSAEYTTEGATPDGDVGSCYGNGGPLHNVWFKFEAPEFGYGHIYVYVGGSDGTQTYTLLTLWDSDGNELGCGSFDDADVDPVFVYYNDLDPGETYYFYVDVQDSDYVGTFTLCLDDSD
jgi:hypothetical protein